MNVTTLKQTDKTKKFIRHVKNLKETGEVKNYTEIIDAMEWDKTAFSNVLNGRENIPAFRFVKFSEVYGMVDDPESLSIQNLLRIDAKCDTILTTLAELLAHQKGQTVEKIKTDLVETVNLRLKELTAQL